MVCLLVVLLWLAASILAIPAPEQELDGMAPQGLSKRFPLSRSEDHRRCSFPGGRCYSDKDCCFAHCGVRPAIWPPVPGKCVWPFSTVSSVRTATDPTTSPRQSTTTSTKKGMSAPVSQSITSSCKPIQTVSTIYSTTKWTSAGTTYLSRVESTVTLTVTPACTGAGTTGSATSTIKSSMSSHSSVRSTIPCLPSYYTNTMTRVYRTTIRGVPTTVTTRVIEPVTYDPPCAFSNPGEPTASATLTRQTTSHQSPPSSMATHSLTSLSCSTLTYIFFQYFDYTTTIGTTTEHGIRISPVTGTNTICPASDGPHTTHTSQSSSLSTRKSSTTTPCVASTLTYTFTDTFTSPYHTYTAYAIADPPCAFGQPSETMYPPSTIDTVTSTRPGPSSPDRTTHISKSTTSTTTKRDMSTRMPIPVSTTPRRSSSTTPSLPSTTVHPGLCQPITNTFNVTVTSTYTSGRSTSYSIITSTETVIISPACTVISQLGPGPVILSTTSTM